MWSLKYFTSYAPFLGMLLEHMLHKTEGVNQETGRHGRQETEYSAKERGEGTHWDNGDSKLLRVDLLRATWTKLEGPWGDSFNNGTLRVSLLCLYI